MIRTQTLANARTAMLLVAGVVLLVIGLLAFAYVFARLAFPQ